MQRKQITLRDVIAHIQGTKNKLKEDIGVVRQDLRRMENRMDRMERKIDCINVGEDNIDKRLRDMEGHFLPEKVRNHARRISRLERRSLNSVR